MADKSWQELKEILADALDLPADARADFLAKACGGDVALRREVDRHLAYDLPERTRASDSMPQSLTSPTQGRFDSVSELDRDEWIGPYRLMGRPIGTGGMGTVYKAERRAPFQKTVALKRIKLGFDTTEVLARFDSERQALARMDHPNIAKVLDAGTDSTGRPYFVMDYIPGVPITQFADDNRFTVTRRLELFTQVCDAIAHAHTKAIIHRDIKTSNVLAYMADGKPAVKVIDFGIAKALTGDRLTDLTFDTARGRVVGTYESMSPEQADGSADIDTRTDIYSLGVLLYELLAGAKPFDRDTFAKTDHEIRRIIKEVEPPRPSNRLSSLGQAGTRVAAARKAHVDALAKQLRSELEWIPMMAMRKERDRRYANPLELAADIRNYLEKRPLRAGPESAAYRLRKQLWRNKGPVGAIAAIIMLLVAGTAVSTWQALRASAAGVVVSSQLSTLNQQNKELIETKRQLELNLAQVSHSLTMEGDLLGKSNRNGEARQRYWDAVEIVERLGLSQVPLRARLLDTFGDESPLMGSYGWQGGIGGFTGHRGDINAVAVSYDGKKAISASEDTTLRLWDLDTGRLIRAFEGAAGHKEIVTFVTFCPDGQTALSASNDGTIKIWDVSRGTLKRTLQSQCKQVWVVACAPDGRRALSGGVAGGPSSEMELWDLTDPARDKPLRTFRGHTREIAGIAFSPVDGRRVLSASHDGSIKLWDVESGEWDQSRAFRGHTKEVNCIAFSPDGTRAASASFDGSVRIWDVATGVQLGKEMAGHLDWVWRVQFSSDGQLLASASRDGTVRLWNVQTQEQVGPPYNAGEGGVMGAAFLPDISGMVSTRGAPPGRNLLAEESSLTLWKIDPARLMQAGAEAPRQVTGSAISNDRAVLLGTAGGEVVLWDASTKKRFWTIPDQQSVRTVSLSADGRRALSGHDDGNILLLDVLTGKQVQTLHAPRAVRGVAFLPDEAQAAVSGGDDGALRMWDLATGKPRGEFQGGGGPIIALSLSRDGQAALTACEAGPVSLWDLRDSTKVKSDPQDFKADAMAWSETAKNLVLYTASGRDTPGLCFADITKGSVRELLGHRARVRAMAFSRDGKMAMTGDEQGNVVLWDIESQVQFREFEKAHPQAVTSLAFSPDGTCAVSTSGDGTIRVWDFDRALRQRDLEIRARKLLVQPAHEAAALAALGEWHAFRGRWSSAKALLEDARSRGARVSSLALGQCDWHLGYIPAAHEEFVKAVRQEERPGLYARLCERATEKRPDTVPSSNGGPGAAAP